MSEVRRFRRDGREWEFRPGKGGSLTTVKPEKQKGFDFERKRRAKVIGPAMPEEEPKRYALKMSGGRMVYSR